MMTHWTSAGEKMLYSMYSWAHNRSDSSGFFDGRLLLSIFLSQDVEIHNQFIRPHSILLGFTNSRFAWIQRNLTF